MQQWTERKVDGDLARQLRREIRLYRREKGKGGHKFSFNDLRAIYAPESDSGDIEHAVVTHNADTAWQHYWRHPTRGWLQQHAYHSQDDAYRGVEAFQPYDPKLPPTRAAAPVKDEPEEKGTRVIAGWPNRPATIKVKTSTPWTTQQLHDTLARLGLTTIVKES